MAIVEIWAYRDVGWGAADLTGFRVAEVDGDIGKVDEASNEVGSSYIVVDTGPWIFGKKVMLPAGVIDRVDFENEVVHVNRTRDEIKNAPEFDPDTYRQQVYRDELGGYYSRSAR